MINNNDTESARTGTVTETKTENLQVTDYILLFLRYKKLILLISLIIGCITAIIVFLIMDPIFLSVSTVKSSGTRSVFLSSLEGIPDLGGLDDLGFGNKNVKELQYYSEILNSRRCIEPLIVKYDLMNREGFRYMEDAVKAFRETWMVLEIDEKSSVLRVGVYNTNPNEAKEMVEFLIDQLDKINIEININKAKNNREFIETRYIQALNDLRNSEDTLKNFQVIYGLAPDLQSKASYQTALTMEAEIKAEEVKLDVLKKILSPDQIEVQTQEAKIQSLKSKLGEIKNGTDNTDILQLGNSPQINLSFLRHQRQIELNGKIVTFLLPLYEQAKIEEKKETPTILILEKAYVPEKKAKPKRLTSVLISMLSAMAITYLFIFMYEFYLKKNIVLIRTKSRTYRKAK